jgi:hypothetical protein
MKYLLGACYGGLSRALILNVTNPTHPTKDFYRADIFGIYPWLSVGCHGVFLYGACDGGIPRVLILHVSNPVGGLSESDFFALILQFEIDEMCP